jgi:hypothetical protein
MRVRAWVAFAGLIATFGFARTNQGSAPSIEVRATDWEISDWAQVRRGQLSVQHSPQQDSLKVDYLAKFFGPAGYHGIRSSTPHFSGHYYLLSTFDSGTQNKLGGYFNPFFSSPSSATAAISLWSDGRLALTLDYLRENQAFCGMWVHLFDFKKPQDERVYFDARPFDALAFWVRGSQGNERILLKVADAAWEKKEDALSVGEISNFISTHRLETKWQPAIVPLKNLPGALDRSALASISFEALDPGRGRVAIKDLAFCKSPQPPPLSPPLSRPADGKSKEQAMWIWNTQSILADTRQQREMIAFAQRMRIKHLFLQLPNEPSDIGSKGEIRLQEEIWKPFLQSMNAAGIHAYALDGSKSYALSAWHERVLLTADNVVRYNASVEPDQRFRGIHYDIEPYLLEGYHGPRRSEILQSYLRLIEGISAKTRSSGLVLGVDIPFWYDTLDPFTGRPVLIEFGGHLKPVSQHLIDLVDQIAVMDYRTSSYGADGLIAHAQDELSYALEKGKRVFVGVETTELPDEELLDFEGEPKLGLPQNAPDGYSVLVSPGPETATLWVISGSQWNAVRRVLTQSGRDMRSILWWPIKKITPVPSHRITFANLGIERLRRVTAEAEEEFRAYGSFAGFAIHDYIGYRRLLERSQD